MEKQNISTDNSRHPLAAKMNEQGPDLPTF